MYNTYQHTIPTYTRDGLTNTHTYINGGREEGASRFGGSRRPYCWGKIRTGEGGAAITKLVMTITMMAIWGGGVCEEEKEGEDRIGYVYVCYTLGYWVCVWEGCLGSKGMGKHGEKEFDIIDMDILVFWYGAKFRGDGVWGRGGIS